MITLSVIEKEPEIVRLLETLCRKKEIRLSRTMRPNSDFVLLSPNSSMSCDILLQNIPLSHFKRKADYISIINSDEKIAPDRKSRELVITYGLNALSTLTASSLRHTPEYFDFHCCLQRTIVTLKGKVIEPQEFPVRIGMPISGIHTAMGLTALALVLSFEPEELSNISPSKK